MADLRYISRSATHRCNTRKRLRHAFRLGCDSVDGSGFSRWPDERIPAALRWLADLHGTQPPEALRRDLTHRFLRAAADGPALLDGQGWVIEAVCLQENAYRVCARFTPEPDRCPACGADAVSGGAVHRHGTRPQAVRDAPRDGHPVIVVVDRRRYRCRGCGRTFLQPLPGLRGRSPVSAELAACLARGAQLRPRIQVAREAGLDVKTVRRVLAGVLPDTAA